MSKKLNKFSLLTTFSLVIGIGTLTSLLPLSNPSTTLTVDTTNKYTSDYSAKTGLEELSINEADKNALNAVNISIDSNELKNVLRRTFCEPTNLQKIYTNLNFSANKDYANYFSFDSILFSKGSLTCNVTVGDGVGIFNLQPGTTLSQFNLTNFTFKGFNLPQATSIIGVTTKPAEFEKIQDRAPHQVIPANLMAALNVQFGRGAPNGCIVSIPQDGLEYDNLEGSIKIRQMQLSLAYDGIDYTSTQKDKKLNVNFDISGFRRCNTTNIEGLSFDAKNLQQNIYQYLIKNNMEPLGNDFQPHDIICEVKGDKAVVTINKYYNSAGT